MSTLKTNAITSRTGSDLVLTGDSGNTVDIETGFKVSGTAGVPVADIRTSSGTASASTFLRGDGQWQAAGGGQWSLKTSGTVSGAANLTISSITKRVFIFCQDVTMASTAELYLMTQPISSSSFPYLNWVDHSSHTGTTSITTIRGTGSTHMTLTAQQSVAAASNRMLNCWIELPDPANTVARQLLRYYSLFKIGDAYHSWGFGEQREDVSHADAGAIDVVKIEASTGNLSMGNYYVWEQG